MKSPERDRRRLVRAFPPRWRDRYGAELDALIEDALEGRRPTLRFRASILRAGLAERSRESGLTGTSASASMRTTTGGMVIVWAWTAFIVAGCAFAKVTEHTRPVSMVGAVTVLAGVAMGAVVLGAVRATPAAWAAARRDCSGAIARAVRRAAAATAVAGLAFVVLVAWAQALSASAREAAGWRYGSAVAVTAVLVFVAMACWTGAAMSVVRRMSASASLLRLESRLAVVVVGAMLAMTVATVLWWVRANPVGGMQLAVIVSWMVAADLAACFGASRLRVA